MLPEGPQQQPHVVCGDRVTSLEDERWNVSLTGTVSEETTTTENGADYYRAGRRYLGTASAAYTWSETIGQTTLTGSVSMLSSAPDACQGAVFTIPVTITAASN